MTEATSRITQILLRLDLGNRDEIDELLGLVYDDLRAIAARQLGRERNARVLRPTALVHEAYLKLASGPSLSLEGRSHFFRVAARAMRQVLVDAARRRTAAKRGGAWRRVTLEPDLIADTREEWEVLALHEALERLGAMDPRLERLVELRFFGGLSVEEAAASLGVSPRKAAKDWATARLWLARELGG